jgi:hypothetical protein
MEKKVAKAAFFFLFFHGCIAPMVEQLIPNQWVGGSNPSAPAIFIDKNGNLTFTIFWFDKGNLTKLRFLAQYLKKNKYMYRHFTTHIA